MNYFLSYITEKLTMAIFIKELNDVLAVKTTHEHIYTQLTKGNISKDIAPLISDYIPFDCLLIKLYTFKSKGDEHEMCRVLNEFTTITKHVPYNHYDEVFIVILQLWWIMVRNSYKERNDYRMRDYTTEGTLKFKICKIQTRLDILMYNKYNFMYSSEYVTDVVRGFKCLKDHELLHSQSYQHFKHFINGLICQRK